MSGNIYTKIINSKIQELFSIREMTNGWKFEKKGNSLSLYSRKYMENKINLNKIVGTLPTRFESAVEYFSEGVFNNEKEQKCSRQDVIEKVDQDTFIIHERLKGNLIFSPREFLNVQHKRIINENEVLIVRQDINNHHFICPNNDAIRGQQVVYGIFLTKLTEQMTGFQAYMLFNLQGSIPSSIQNSITAHNINVFEDKIPCMQKN